MSYKTKNFQTIAPCLMAVMLFIFSCSTGNQGAPATRHPEDSLKVTRQIVTPVESPGKRVSYNGHSYDTYTLPLAGENLRLYWKDDSGKKLKSMAALKRYVESKSAELLFATNAGMYTTTNSPLGLYIEAGKELVLLNTKTGKSGNFYMQSNGVFFTTKSSAGVVTTSEFSKHKDSVIYATQSGPMLVVNGVINDKFVKGSKNLNIRSGVGISRDGKIVFTISNEPVSFYDFAEFFKDFASCDNALYLDGAISKMYLPEIGRNELDGSFGGMIGVVR